MTELIVALDGPNPSLLAAKLHAQADVTWFKLGPQAMVDPRWGFILAVGSRSNVKIFLDLKLADTRDTVREAVKRFAAAGIASVSTYTMSATEAALEASEGTTIHIWQLLALSDIESKLPAPYLHGAHGLICPPYMLINHPPANEIIVPGIRFLSDDQHGHAFVAMPSAVTTHGGTHAVVGRPIWSAPDPVSTALEYKRALSGVSS